jgi:hypothetical protein
MYGLNPDLTMKEIQTIVRICTTRAQEKRFQVSKLVSELAHGWLFIIPKSERISSRSENSVTETARPAQVLSLKNSHTPSRCPVHGAGARLLPDTRVRSGPARVSRLVRARVSGRSGLSTRVSGSHRDSVTASGSQAQPEAQRTQAGSWQP